MFILIRQRFRLNKIEVKYKFKFHSILYAGQNHLFFSIKQFSWRHEIENHFQSNNLFHVLSILFNFVQFTKHDPT